MPTKQTITPRCETMGLKALRGLKRMITLGIFSTVLWHYPISDAKLSKAQRLTLAPQELRCLEHAIYHEARGESIRGKLKVAEVILNRTKSGKFPRTICAVVYQPGQFTNIKATRYVRQRHFQNLALQAYLEYKPSRFLYFHNITIPPKRGAVRVGNHYFY